MKKYYKFIFIALFGLFIFLPKDTFASESISVRTYEFFWDARNPNGQTETGRFSLAPLQRLQFGSADGTYQLIRVAPLIFFNNLSKDTFYSATVMFYFETHTPYSLDNPYCSLFGGVNSQSTCSTSLVSETQINSTKSLITYKVQYQWSSNEGYVEFWLNFNNALLNPSKTTFFYQIFDFVGDVDKNQIIIDGLEETNKKLDDLKDSQDKTNENLKDIEESITSEDAPDLDALEDSAGWLPPGPVDSILNLPLTFFNNLISNLSKTCQPVQIPLPYVAQNLTLPCISSLYEQIGATTFLNWVGLIVGTIILYNYFLNLYKWIDDTIQMKDNSVDDWGGV